MEKKEIAIPAILKVGADTLSQIGVYLSEKNISKVVIYFGNGLINLFGDKVMNGLTEANITVLHYEELDTVRIEDIMTMAFSIPNDTQAILGIGGGKVIDAAKYMCYLRKLCFISVPTSASSDGFCSSTASLIDTTLGVSVYFSSYIPKLNIALSTLLRRFISQSTKYLFARLEISS